MTWKEILELKRKYGDGEWCIGAYFNSGISMMERKGSALVNMSSEMWQFSEFIEDSNLVDLPYKGKY